MGEEKPCGCGGDGGLEVLGEASASSEPGKGALDDPSAGQELEALDARRPLDDFDRPWAAIVDGVRAIASLGRCGRRRCGAGWGSFGAARATAARHREDPGCWPHGPAPTNRKPWVSVTIWRLRPLMRLPASTPRGPPLSVVGALWLSMMAAEGATLRPSIWRARDTTPGVEPAPRAVVAPAVEVALHRRTRREVRGQGAPLAAGRQNIKDRIDDQAQIAGPRPAQAAAPAAEGLRP